MLTFLRRFIALDAAAGVILIVVTILAVTLANMSATAAAYQSFLSLPVVFQVGSLEINKTLLLWINDGLMALFFLMVGLEVKREMMIGSLASRQQALLPMAGAVGGMLVPALIYLSFNWADETTRMGWAIPAATDIAFALGVLTLLGRRVPSGLKVFLLTLAIVDDLGAIVIIALFYTQQMYWPALLGAAVCVLVLCYLNQQKVTKTSLYLVVGVVLWVCVLKSGVHATLAGVTVGAFIPLRSAPQKPSPAITLEHGLHEWVAFLILPLFAFANAGIVLDGVSFSKLFSPLTLGIALGLLLGKPLGVGLFSWLALQSGHAHLPQGVNFKQVVAVSLLCGIGFTMSIFIALLAFYQADATLIIYAKLGILLGSIIAAVAGYWLVHRTLPAADATPENDA